MNDFRALRADGPGETAHLADLGIDVGVDVLDGPPWM
jgi:hypothetical protein